MMQNAAIKPYEDDQPDYVPRIVSTTPSDVQTRIFGMMSAVGGTGVTMIAAEMAFSLANKFPASRTALLSLDFENNSLAFQLHLKPHVPVEYFMQSPAQLDVETCQGWMSATQYGFDVLTLPTSVDGNQRVNPDTVITFLDLISRQYEFLILDIPRIWMPWTHASLGASDKVAMVCELNIPCLHLTREKCGALIKAVDLQNGIEVILNKYEKKTFRNAINRSDAQDMFLNMKLQAITRQDEKVRDALNRGEPLGVTYSGSKTAKDIDEILTQWLAETQPRDAQMSGET